MPRQCPKCFQESRTQKAYAKHVVKHYGEVSHELPSNQEKELSAKEMRRLETGGYSRPLEKALGEVKTGKKRGWSRAEKAAYLSLLI